VLTDTKDAAIGPCLAGTPPGAVAHGHAPCRAARTTVKPVLLDPRVIATCCASTRHGKTQAGRTPRSRRLREVADRKGRLGKSMSKQIAIAQRWSGPWARKHPRSWREFVFNAGMLLRLN